MADQIKFCDNCGQPLNPDARFCAGCGKAVTGPSPVPPTPPPPGPTPSAPFPQSATPIPEIIKGTKGFIPWIIGGLGTCHSWRGDRRILLGKIQ